MILRKKCDTEEDKFGARKIPQRNFNRHLKVKNRLTENEWGDFGMI